jgi:hypothetical protein
MGVRSCRGARNTHATGVPDGHLYNFPCIELRATCLFCVETHRCPASSSSRSSLAHLGALELVCTASPIRIQVTDSGDLGVALT